jgi:hypothetical protein
MAQQKQLDLTFDETLKSLVGSTFVKRVNNVADAPLRIGGKTWTTHQLAVRLGVVHTKAARLLTVAADSIGVKSVKELYQKATPYTLAGVHGFGETTMYVLWRLFESEGFDPDKWAMAGDQDDALISFRGLKIREQAADKRTRKSVRRRTHTDAAAHAAMRG